jgi:hypothetical protein
MRIKDGDAIPEIWNFIELPIEENVTKIKIYRFVQKTASFHRATSSINSSQKRCT